MSDHPYKKYAEDKVGKSRAHEMIRGYKSGGRVPKIVINVNSREGPGEARPPLPLPPLGPPAPPMMGVPPVPPGGAGPPRPPGMKTGGAVKMTAGAESGVGRLQKVAIQKRKK